MKKRLLTSLYIGLALILAILSRFITLYIFDLIVMVLAIMGTVEIARVLERMKKFSSIIITGSFPALLYTITLIGFFMRWEIGYTLLAYLALINFVFVLSIVLSLIQTNTTKREMLKLDRPRTTTRFIIDKAFNTIFVVVYPSILFISLVFLSRFGGLNYILDSNYLAQNGFTLSSFFLIMAITITVVTDSFAMLIGTWLKGPKIFPVLSPKKTYSGAVGGLLGGLLASFIVYWLFSIDPNFVDLFNQLYSIEFVVFLGLFGAFFCQFGDIFASILKRKARVKDYGTIFPGHGGVMDRFDGLIFTSTFILICAVISVMIY